MTSSVEGVVRGGMKRKEPLCGSGRSKPLHLAFPSSDVHVRSLDPVVLLVALVMRGGDFEAPEGRGVGS